MSTSPLSRHIQTTWKLKAQVPMRLEELGASVRFFPQEEANTLADFVRRKNVVARFGGFANFYFQRTQMLGGCTVIEVFRRGHPDAIAETLDRLTVLIERIALLSSLVSMNRKQFHEHLAITAHLHRASALTIGPHVYTLRSKGRSEKRARGVPIDARFVKRFRRLEFPTLIQYCMSQSALAPRVSAALSWLLESREEAGLEGAIVKTSIALESLLIFNDTEPLSRSLSERCAFMLSQDPNDRASISKLIRDFYESRSGIVHGGRRKTESLSVRLLEAVDRLTLYLALVLAANQDKWTSQEALRLWCESQRWDAPDTTVKSPYSKKHLDNTLKLAKAR